MSLRRFQSREWHISCASIFHVSCRRSSQRGEIFFGLEIISELAQLKEKTFHIIVSPWLSVQPNQSLEPTAGRHEAHV
jgi:hypothetical protein